MTEDFGRRAEFRDRFACAVLQGLLASGQMKSNSNLESDEEMRRRIAVGCYEMADAMLAARLPPADEPNEFEPKPPESA